MPPLSERLSRGGWSGRVARHFFSPLAHFGVVSLKRVATIQVPRKMVAPNLKPGSLDGEEQSSRDCKAWLKAMWTHLNEKKKEVLVVAKSGPRVWGWGFLSEAPHKMGVSFRMATSRHGAPQLYQASDMMMWHAWHVGPWCGRWRIQPHSMWSLLRYY